MTMQTLKKKILDTAVATVAINSKFVTDVFPIAFTTYTSDKERTALKLGRLVPSLNLSDYPHLDCRVESRYQMWIKNYSEMEGVADCLCATPMFEKIDQAILGFASTKVVLIEVVDPKLREAIDKVHKTPV